MSTATKNGYRRSIKLPRGSKYRYPVATTIVGTTAERARKLRDQHAVSISTIVRTAVIEKVKRQYRIVEAGLGPDLICRSGCEVRSTKAGSAAKLHVMTQIDKPTFTLLRRLKKKTHVCTAQLIREPVIEAINNRYEQVAA